MQKQEEKKEEVIKKDECEKELKEKKNETNSKDVEENKKTKVKKKWVKPAVITGIIILVLFIFSVIFAIINNNEDKIVSGITINGVEVSGLTKDEAKEKLETIINEKKSKEISLKYEEFQVEVSPELIEANYNVEKAVEDAYNIGRDSNIFVNNYNILFTMLGKKNIDLELTVNDEELEKNLKDTSSKLPGAIKESSYYIEDDNLIITKGNKGVAIDIEENKDKIKEYLKNISENNQDYIEINVFEKEPEEINIDQIYNEVHKEAKDAYYTRDPFQIYPEVNGVDFNIEEVRELLKEDKEEYRIKLTITIPKVTIDQIGTEAFPDRLAIFTTNYNAGDVNRTTNLRIACEKINGKVILAGETFSYNKTLGERTIAAGYKEAKVYENGKVVDGLGGGICQISSTLYNAVVMSNLEIVERRNHQFVTSYASAGRDATVVYGLTDFRFKNTRNYPIRIVANVQGGVATVAIYGIKEENEYNITFETRTIATLPFSTQYVEDTTLAQGTEVVEQKGANGIQTETYIVKTLNGAVVSRELLSKDTYNPMQRIVRRGVTAQPVAPAEPVTPTEPVAPAETPAPAVTETPATAPVENPGSEAPVTSPTE